MAHQTIKVHAILTEPNLATEAGIKQMLADASAMYASIGWTFELASLKEDFTNDLAMDGEKGPLPLEFELKRTAWNGETWRGWLADVGEGTFLSGPAAIVSADHAIYLFALGDDRNIWHSAWENQSWSLWEPTFSGGTFQP